MSLTHARTHAPALPRVVENISQHGDDFLAARRHGVRGGVGADGREGGGERGRRAGHRPAGAVADAAAEAVVEEEAESGEELGEAEEGLARVVL